MQMVGSCALRCGANVWNTVVVCVVSVLGVVTTLLLTAHLVLLYPWYVSQFSTPFSTSLATMPSIHNANRPISNITFRSSKRRACPHSAISLKSPLSSRSCLLSSFELVKLASSIMLSPIVLTLPSPLICAPASLPLVICALPQPPATIGLHRHDTF